MTSVIILPPVSLTFDTDRNGRLVSLAVVIILISTFYVQLGQAVDVVNVGCQCTAGITDSNKPALFGHSSRITVKNRNNANGIVL
jgi:hypothetical protein